MQGKIARVKKKIHLLVTVASLTMIGGCDLLNPDRYLITRDGTQSRIIGDSTEVERLLSAQRARDSKVDPFWKEGPSKEDGIKRIQDMERNPERYTPGRKEFLLAMSLQPAVSVAGRTYARLLEFSGAKCTPNPLVTSKYIKVRITSGPSRGHEGWVCEDNVFRTVVLP